MDKLDFVVLSLFCGAPLLAATLFIPGLIAGLGTALIAKISAPALRPKDLLLISLAWVLALMVGAYVASVIESIQAQLIAANTEGVMPSFYMVFEYAISLAVGGFIAGAMGAGVTFHYLRRALEISGVDGA